MVNLSILELGGVREGATRKDALNSALTMAQRAEELGFHRFWVAEHHNMATVTTAATSVVLGYIAAGTSFIRVGAGGIMLPNHAPYVIAEQFGTLETLYPGRIDLGLGRAPGTDQITLHALRRDAAASSHFPQDVLELQAYLGPVQPGQRIEAVPGSNTNIPLWILGSSLFGAQLAAELGLPYAFASHFAPQALHEALRIYRERFKPSEQLEKPHAMVAVNIIAADTDDEAEYLSTSQKIMFTNMLRGKRGLFPAPIDDIDSYWSPMEKIQASSMLACSIVGGPETVEKGLRKLLAETHADELIMASNIFDQNKRLRSLEIVAQAASLRRPEPTSSAA
ncbi:MAG: LLM class flavin-dependent oxidoreductase [bacterium]